MNDWITMPDGTRMFCPCPREPSPRAAQDKPAENSQSWHVALVLAAVLGFTGAHRFYTGKIGSGAAWLLTGGLLGIGALADVASIAASRWRAADGTPLSRQAAKGSLAAAGIAVAWALAAWITTAAALAMTAVTVVAWMSLNV